MAIFEKKSEDKKEQGHAKAGGHKHKSALSKVLVQPRISEKAARLVKENQYVFNVLRSANKVTVKKAVEEVYKVKVVKVTVVNTQGKAKNYGRTTGVTSGFKKAIVTLKKGDKIEGTVETI